MNKFLGLRFLNSQRHSGNFVGLVMFIVAFFTASALFLPVSKSWQGQRAVAQIVSNQALEARCTQNIVPNVSGRGKFFLLTGRRSGIPSSFEGSPYEALSSFGALIDGETSNHLQFVEVNFPECLQYLRERAQYYHQEEQTLERPVGIFQVDAASRREYCSVAIPTNSTSCPFARPGDNSLIADLNPAQIPLLLRDQVQVLLRLSTSNPASFNSGNLKFFITPTPLFRNAPSVHYYRQASDYSNEWEKVDSIIHGYVSFVSSISASEAPADVTATQERGRSNFPISDVFYQRLTSTETPTPGHILEISFLRTLIDQGAARLVSEIRTLSQSLTSRWRQDPELQSQGTGWVAFFERRALTVQSLKRTYSAELLGRVAEMGHNLVANSLATATDLNAITDAAGLWWTLRELQLAMACDAAGDHLERPEERGLVEIQYSLQNCRHLYVHQAVLSLNRRVSLSGRQDQSTRELQLDSPEWVRSFVLGSRKERSKNISTALGLLTSQLRQNIAPHMQTLSTLRTELQQLQEELGRNQVVTWLGIKEMTASDRAVLLREVEAFHHFFTAFGAWLQPDRSQRISAYVTFRALWRDFASLLSLRPWLELFEAPSMAELNAANLAHSLESLRIPPLGSAAEKLRPLSEMLSFTASAFASDPQQAQGACSAIIQWVFSHPQWVLLAENHRGSIPLEEFSGTPACFNYIVKIINRGDVRQFQSLGRTNTLEEQCQQAQENAAANSSFSGYAALVCPLVQLLKPVETRGLPAQWLNLLGQPYWSQAEYVAMLDALKEFFITLPANQQGRGGPWFRMVLALIDQEKQKIRNDLTLPTVRYLTRCLDAESSTRPAGELMNASSIVASFMVRSQCQPFMGQGSLAHWLGSQLFLAKQVQRQQGVAAEFLRPEEFDNLIDHFSRWVALRVHFEDLVFRIGGPRVLAGPVLFSEREFQALQGRVAEVSALFSGHPQGAQPPMLWIGQSLLYLQREMLPLMQAIAACNGRAIPCIPEAVINSSR